MVAVGLLLLLALRPASTYRVNVSQRASFASLGARSHPRLVHKEMERFWIFGGS